MKFETILENLELNFDHLAGKNFMMVVLGDFNAKSNGMLKTAQILKDWSDLPTSDEQGSFISEMEWAPFKCLLWNDNILTVKLMISITSGASLWYRPCYKKYVKLWQRQQMLKTYNSMEVNFLFS